MLTNNQSHDQTVKRQCLTEDEHDEHANEQLVLVVTAAHIIAAGGTAVIVGDGGIPRRLGNTAGEQTDAARSVAHRPDTGVTNDANAPTSGQSGNTRTETRAQMGKGLYELMRVSAPGLGMDSAKMTATTRP